MILNLKVSEQTISLQSNKSEPRRGSKEYLKLRFTFSADWADIIKYVYFQYEDISLPIELVDGTVTVPEYFTEQGEFIVTLFGKSADGAIEIPTNVLKIKLSESNNLWQKDAPAPQNSWFVQVLEARDEAVDAASRAEAAIAHLPYPNEETGTWWLWDFESASYIDSGLPYTGSGGGSGADGGYYTPEVTQTSENTMQVAFSPSKTSMPAVSGTEITLPAGQKGDKGDTGATGADGKSAYAYAVEGGYTGTEAEFAAKLAEEYPHGIVEATGGAVTEGNLVVWDIDSSLVRDGGAVPIKLPNPNALTFTGAVTGSYDGSAPLSVEIPQGGTGGGGALAGLTIADNYDIELISHVIIDQGNIPTAGITVTQKDDGSTFAYDGLLIWSDAKSSATYTKFNFNGYTNYPLEFTHGDSKFLNLYITDGVTMSIQSSGTVRNIIKQSYADTGNQFYPEIAFQRVPEKFTSFTIGANGIATVTFYKAWGLIRK